MMLPSVMNLKAVSTSPPVITNSTSSQPKGEFTPLPGATEPLTDLHQLTPFYQRVFYALKSFYPQSEQPLPPKGVVIPPPEKPSQPKRQPPEILDKPETPLNQHPVKRRGRNLVTRPFINTVFPKPERIALAPLFQSIDFKQGKIGNCYFLAALYSILQNPNMKNFFIQNSRLEKTVLEGGGEKYTFTFPSGLKAEMDASEIGKAKGRYKPVSAPWIIQLMELAYAKAERSERNQKQPTPFENSGAGKTFKLIAGGQAPKAIAKMLGSIVKTKSYPLNLVEAKRLLANIQADEDHIYILNASTPAKVDDQTSVFHLLQSGKIGKFPGTHAYSIILNDSPKTPFISVNPHNTATNVHAMGDQTLGRVFEWIHIAKIAKKDLLRVPSKTQENNPLGHLFKQPQSMADPSEEKGGTLKRFSKRPNSMVDSLEDQQAVEQVSKRPKSIAVAPSA